MILAAPSIYYMGSGEEESGSGGALGSLTSGAKDKAASILDKQGMKFYFALEFVIFVLLFIDMVNDDPKSHTIMCLVFIVILLNLVMPAVQIKIIMDKLKNDAISIVKEITIHDKTRMDQGTDEVEFGDAASDGQYWLLFFTLFCGLGTSFAVFEHSKQIATATKAERVIIFFNQLRKDIMPDSPTSSFTLLEFIYSPSLQFGLPKKPAHTHISSSVLYSLSSETSLLLYSHHHTDTSGCIWLKSSLDLDLDSN